MTGEMTRPITLDDFAAMCMREFRRIHEKFSLIDKRFDQIDERFEGIEKRFEGVDKKFEGIDGILTYLTENMATKSDLYGVESRLNFKIDALDQKVGDIEKHIGRMEVRLENLSEIILDDHRPRILALEKALL